MFEREQEGGRGRHWLQRVFLLALGVLASLALAEIGIRVAGILAPFGRDGSVEGGHFVVLCVGDSHTWGNGRGYPRRLSQRLAALSKEYRVINLGVPGTNTAQLRNRFAAFLERYDPGLVVIWTGVNNRWNRSETEVWSEAEVAPASLTARALDEVRLLRLVRL